ncbi:hypothetical protein F25303_4283 [Fusarium sp. NRRL 25303]|nr:hypothetical protein F25303_4283 [Fusarium sp. NRRL 25303]
MLRSRSNSSYSLQDLSHRPPSHRPSQTSDGNSSDTRPRNSNTSARGDVSAAPQKEEEEQKRSRLGRFWHEYVSCEVDFSASRDHLGMCTEGELERDWRKIFDGHEERGLVMWA